MKESNRVMLTIGKMLCDVRYLGLLQAFLIAYKVSVGVRKIIKLVCKLFLGKC